MRTSLLVIGSLVLSVLGAACGDDGGSGGSGGAGGSAQGGGGNGSGGGAQGGGGSGPECNPPEPQPGTPNDVPIDNVAVIARDEAGDPIANVTLQLCGKDNCLFAETSTIGQATFTSQAPTLDRPMFKPNDSLDYGKIGYPYLTTSPSPLPGYFPTMNDSGSAMTPGSEVSAGGVTLTLPAGGAVVVDDLIYDEPAKQTFRAASLPTQVLASLPDLAEFDMLFTLGPIDTLFCPNAEATLDNYAMLPADAAVEIWAQELNVSEHFGGYGEWFKLADGVVSADGMTVSVTGGLPALLTIAVKAVN